MERKETGIVMLGEKEICRAIAHYLSRQGSEEYDVQDVYLVGRGPSRHDVTYTVEATAIPRRARVTG